MPSTLFKPSRIFVDSAVEKLPLTETILSKFPGIPWERISDPKMLKQRADITGSKKQLLLAKMKAAPIKEFRAMTKSSGRSYYSLGLISNCHLECTYCILQSYLENNPVMTIYTNIEEILERLGEQLKTIPHNSVVGTGKIADSLALDDISEHTKFIVPFFAKQDRVRLELKTKSDNVSHLLNLDHGGRTTLSWSLNPPQIIEREEYKTASLEERLHAAFQVSKKNYPVAFHFDPVIFHERWKENYASTIDLVFKKIPPEKIAWVSVGTLRLPARQAKIMKKRFPKNSEVLEKLVSTDRKFLHYADGLREEIQSWIELRLHDHLPAEKTYRCMDFG